MYMELRKLIESILHECLNEQKEIENNLIFYHGSKYSKITFSSKDNDFGRQLFGYGFYVSSDKYESIEYYSLDGNTDGYLYTIKTEKLNFVYWNKQVSDEIRNYVKNLPNFMNLFYEKIDFKNLNFNDYEYKVGDTYYSWDFLENPLPKWVIDDNGKVGYFLEVNKKGVKDEIYYGLTEDGILDFIKNNTNINYKELKIDDPNISTIITKDNLFNSFKNLYWYLTLKFNSTKKTSNFFRKMSIDAIYGDNNNINIINTSKLSIIDKEKINYGVKY